MTLTGQWSYGSGQNFLIQWGELYMSLLRNDDPTTNLVAAYSVWGGQKFRISDTGGSNVSVPRSCPVALVNWRWTITPIGWMFEEDAGSGYETLGNLGTNYMADAGSIVLQLGGWEFSSTPMQEVLYDNITIDVVPEPEIVGMLGICALLMCRRRCR